MLSYKIGILSQVCIKICQPNFCVSSYTDYLWHSCVDEKVAKDDDEDGDVDVDKGGNRRMGCTECTPKLPS